MTRVKRGNVARKRRKKILKLAKGFRGSHSTLFRTANQQVMKALRNSYRDRRKRKRDFRRLWITRINAAVRQHGMSYSQFIGKMKKVVGKEIEEVKKTYLKKYPDAEGFLELEDFAFYRMDIDKIYYVGGFGDIEWIEKSEYVKQIKEE